MTSVARQHRGTLVPLRTLLDWVDFSGSFEVVYIGQGPQEAAESDPVWTVKKIAYFWDGSSNQPDDVQTFEGVAWSDRATLPWS